MLHDLTRNRSSDSIAVKARTAKMHSCEDPGIINFEDGTREAVECTPDAWHSFRVDAERRLVAEDLTEDLRCQSLRG